MARLLSQRRTLVIIVLLLLEVLELFVPVGPQGPLWLLAFVLSFVLLGAARVLERDIDFAAGARPGLKDGGTA